MNCSRAVDSCRVAAGRRDSADSGLTTQTGVVLLRPQTPPRSLSTPLALPLTRTAPVTPRGGGAATPRFSKANRTWECAQDEIFTSERRYCFQLDLCVEWLMRPLLSFATRGSAGATSEELRCLFGNLQEILPLHRRLLRELEAGRDVSDVLVSFCPMFDCYATYIRNYTRGCLLYETLTGDRPAFSALLSRLFEDLTAQYRDSPLADDVLDYLPSYLILPVQKIPRYVLLLEELSKAGRVMKRDMTGISRAVEGIKECVRRLNREADRASTSLAAELAEGELYDDLDDNND